MSNEKTSRAGGVVLGWWSRRIAAENGAARKARAQLKRAGSPSEALALEAVHDLHTILADDVTCGSLRNRPQRLALIATVLAAVETGAGVNLPRRFGERAGEQPTLSPLRFQRILRAGDDWTLAVRLRRALPQVKNACNVAALGNDLFWWGENVRNRWCFDYFGSKPPRQLEDAATATLQSEDA